MKDGPEAEGVKTASSATTNGGGDSCDMRALVEKSRNAVTTLVTIVGDEVAGDNALPLGGTLTAALLAKRDNVVADTNGDEGSKACSKSSANNNNKNNDNRDKIFVCSICNRCFGYKHVLQNHERTHTGEKPFECPECHKRFTRDHHLKTHMRLHTGEKPYQCSHCDRHFVQVANLRRHLRVHTGERPYACQTCTSRFSDSNQLKAHMLIHRGEKPFQCQVCLGRFRRRHHLIHHKCPKDEANLGKPRRGRRPKAYDQLPLSDPEDNALLDNNNSSSEQEMVPQNEQVSPHTVHKNRRKPTHTIRILTPQQRELFLRDKVTMQTQAIDMSLAPSSERPLTVIVPRASRFNSVEGVLDLSSSRSDSEGEPIEEEEEANGVHDADDEDDENSSIDGSSGHGGLRQLRRLIVEPVNGNDNSNDIHLNGEHSCGNTSSSSDDGGATAEKHPNGTIPIPKKASLATA